MKLQPQHLDQVVPLDATYGLMIHRFPGERVCAYIRRVRLDQVYLDTLDALRHHAKSIDSDYHLAAYDYADARAASACMHIEED